MKNRTIIGAGLVAAFACALAFACGDTDEVAPEDGGSTPNARVDSTSADSSTGDAAEGECGQAHSRATPPWGEPDQSREPAPLEPG